MVATSNANAGSYARTHGIVLASTWLLPSSCCRPSPFKVVRPAVPPSMNPRPRASPKAHARSPVRWNPNME